MLLVEGKLGFREEGAGLPHLVHVGPVTGLLPCPAPFSLRATIEQVLPFLHQQVAHLCCSLGARGWGYEPGSATSEPSRLLVAAAFGWYRSTYEPVEERPKQ